MKNRRKNIDELLDVNDLQDMGFTRSMAYSIMNRKDVPTIKIGNRKFVRKDKFYDWLERQEEVPDPDAADDE